jgi:hypothetical protein
MNGPNIQNFQWKERDYRSNSEEHLEAMAQMLGKEMTQLRNFSPSKVRFCDVVPCDPDVIPLLF